jgi:hypothetical protein
MAQQTRIGAHATTVARLDGRLIVTYHTTPIVVVDAQGGVTLHSGGWRSHTTKTRMNQAASQLDLGYHVFQRHHQWFVRVAGCDPVPFADGMHFQS